MAYSAITHIGYIIIALSLSSFFTIDIVFIYVITYILSSISIFAIS
ncbi:MAG: hypothetical protein IPH43_15140 [Xanthomonadales bacterium]|nr:hypothetical protein [Xanthomonadales bacterium]